MKTLSKKRRQMLMELVFPLAVQAVRNSQLTLDGEIKGHWWKFPMGTLSATKTDCEIVLDLLRYVGLGAPQSGSRSRYEIVHIDTNDLDANEIIQLFSADNMALEKSFERLAEEKAHTLIKEEVKKLRQEKKKEIAEYKRTIEKYKEAIRIDRTSVECESIINYRVNEHKKRLNIQYKQRFDDIVKRCKENLRQLSIELEAKYRAAHSQLTLREMSVNRLKEQLSISESIYQLTMELEKYIQQIQLTQRAMIKRYPTDNGAKDSYRVAGKIGQLLMKIKAKKKDLESLETNKPKGD